MRGRIKTGAIAVACYLFLNSVPVKKPTLLPIVVEQHNTIAMH
jgi:hypothetical protein